MVFPIICASDLKMYVFQTYFMLLVKALFATPKLETIKMSCNKWVDKHPLIYPYDGLYSPIKFNELWRTSDMYLKHNW